MSREPVVVFENFNFLAVDKPAGWLSVPSRLGAADERPCAGRWLEEKFGRLWPVHRLDEEVSGLLLFARTAEAHRVASMAFEGREVHKTYEAFTEGRADSGWKPGQSFEWKSRLMRGKKRAYEADYGKEAVTQAKWLGIDEVSGLLRWELHPLTGRSHQLRFELAKRGYPIAGDALYGAKAAWPTGGVALRSVALAWASPEAATLGWKNISLG